VALRKGLFAGSLFVALLSGGALVAYLLAPARHAILGRVVDAAGSPVRGAAVELLPADAAEPRRTEKTDPFGWFSFSRLPGERYGLRATSPGGEAVEEKGVQRGAYATLRLTR
jgi:hypothetical protein